MASGVSIAAIVRNTPIAAVVREGTEDKKAWLGPRLREPPADASISRSPIDAVPQTRAKPSFAKAAHVPLIRAEIRLARIDTTDDSGFLSHVTLLEYLKDNWPEVIWIAVAAGTASYLVGRRARTRWRNRDFLDRLNVSLTRIEQGKLQIRTILEMTCEGIFLNPSAAKNVVELAKKTTADDPILPIPKDDCWLYLNTVLNEISERFAAGQIKRDLGLPVERGIYVLCLTCERAGPVRTQKIRGMLLQKSLLTALPQEEPAYESPTHATRWKTLHQLADQYQKNPHRFIEVEICL